MNELTVDELRQVQGGGDVAMGLAGGLAGSVASYAVGAVVGGARGAMIGGVAGFVLGAAITVAYSLATGGGGRHRKMAVTSH